MVMLLVKALIVLAILVMTVSPKYFFQWLEKTLFEEHDPVTTVAFVDSRQTIQQDSQNLDKEQHTIENIDKMIRSATTDDQRRIWSTKKAEFENLLKWRRLEEFAGGTQRVA